MSTELPPKVKLQAGYIRLIRIILRPPTVSNAIMEFETRIFASNIEVPYFALSYAWGDPRRVRSIFVDGRRCRIADNLYQFLRRVSWTSTGPACWLWIDALSINQSDDEEKNHQVGIMSRIFGRATAVIAWLGPALRDSDAAMRAMSAPSFQKHQTWGPLLDQAICALCERPYWKRFWVFQELKHAREILLLCGSSYLLWAEFEGCRGAINRLRFRMDSKIPARMIELRTKSMDTSLWGLLEATRDMLCEDPRDRVYALLSIATAGHEGIDVDYGPIVDKEKYLLFHGDNILTTLAHRILRNKHAITPPTSLSAVINDCEFLEEVFGLHGAAMFWYGDTSLPLENWIWPEWTWQKSIPFTAWSDWASVHHHSAVAELLPHASPPP